MQHIYTYVYIYISILFLFDDSINRYECFVSIVSFMLSMSCMMSFADSLRCGGRATNRGAVRISSDCSRSLWRSSELPGTPQDSPELPSLRNSSAMYSMSYTCTYDIYMYIYIYIHIYLSKYIHVYINTYHIDRQ